MGGEAYSNKGPLEEPSGTHVSAAARQERAVGCGRHDWAGMEGGCDAGRAWRPAGVSGGDW